MHFPLMYGYAGQSMLSTDTFDIQNSVLMRVLPSNIYFTVSETERTTVSANCSHPA